METDEEPMKPSIREYSDNELLDILLTDDGSHRRELAGLCAEILRRILILHPDFLIDEDADYSDF